MMCSAIMAATRLAVEILNRHALLKEGDITSSHNCAQKLQIVF